MVWYSVRAKSAQYHYKKSENKAIKQRSAVASLSFTLVGDV